MLILNDSSINKKPASRFFLTGFPEERNCRSMQYRFTVWMIQIYTTGDGKSTVEPCNAKGKPRLRLNTETAN
jgi:hypothetical protein